MNIVIADDHTITRKGIMASLLEMFPQANIIECNDADAVLKAAKVYTLDLAIVDLFMPGKDGFSFLKKLCKDHLELPVVVFSATENGQHIQKVIDIGVSGFIHKSSGFELMNKALKTILEGGSYFPPRQETAVSEKETPLDPDVPTNRDALLNNLTKRQLDTLECLAKGMSNKEIASVLFISENTVKSHIKAIMNEMNCNNRTEAVVLSQRLGLLQH